MDLVLAMNACIKYPESVELNVSLCSILFECQFGPGSLLSSIDFGSGKFFCVRFLFIFKFFFKLIIVLGLLFLWWNTVTKDIWGGKRLFCLCFYIAVHYQRTSGPESKQSRSLKAGADAEAVGSRVLPSDFLFMPCLAWFLRGPRTSPGWPQYNGLSTPTLSPHQSITKYENDLQACLQPHLKEGFWWLQLVSRWHKTSQSNNKVSSPFF